MSRGDCCRGTDHLASIRVRCEGSGILAEDRSRCGVRAAKDRALIADLPQLPIFAWRNPDFELVKGIGGKGRIRRMFVRLTRLARVRAGWIAAAVYVLCVLAPGAALALGTASAPCFDHELHAVPAGMTHVHTDGSVHDHSGMHADQAANAGDANHRHDGKTWHGKTSHGKTSHGKTSPGPCCAMLCLSAMPVNLPAITKPSQPISVVASETYRRLTRKAPPLLYRPPIAWSD